MQDNTEEKRLLLGCAGWPHPEWEEGYFPDDLPGDWQFSYCANDCSCFLLPAKVWLGLEQDVLDDWLDDVFGDFRFYLEMPDEDIELALLERFAPHLGGVLGGTQLLPDSIPRLSLSEEGHWLNAKGDPVLWRWTLQGEGLRELRARFEHMSPSVQALIVDGENVDPSRLIEIRTLAELLGVA